MIGERADDDLVQPDPPESSEDDIRAQEDVPVRSSSVVLHVVFWSILVVGAVLDLVSKTAVFAAIGQAKDASIVLVRGFVQFVADTNTGGPFSIFRDNPGWLALATLVALAVIGYLYLASVKERQRLMLVALAMISGGAVGNLFDRLYFGYVRDFVQVWIVDWPYPTFNLADALICTGAGLIFIALVRSGRSQRKIAAQT